MGSVCVIGAGVSGLVTALALRGEGHEVRILAAARGEATTSAVAGAIWMPFQCNPPERVNRWAMETYRWLAGLARTTPEAGVDMLTLCQSTPDRRAPWWRDAVPPEVSMELIESSPLKPGAQAWRCPAPRVDPRVCLPWLEAQLERGGVATAARQITSLAEITDADFVINCTGLGARRLCGDADLGATLGQVVHVEPGGWDMAIAAGDESEGLAYIVPRRGVLLVGGSSEPHDPDAPPEPSTQRQREILARFERWGVPLGAVLGTRVGLRPSRKSVRVEPDPANPRIVHNYGHGGAGWTMCWGCAREVLSIVGPPR